EDGVRVTEDLGSVVPVEVVQRAHRARGLLGCCHLTEPCRNSTGIASRSLRTLYICATQVSLQRTVFRGDEGLAARDLHPGAPGVSLQESGGVPKLGRGTRGASSRRGKGGFAGGTGVRRPPSLRLYRRVIRAAWNGAFTGPRVASAVA